MVPDVVHLSPRGGLAVIDGPRAGRRYGDRDVGRSLDRVPARRTFAFA